MPRMRREQPPPSRTGDKRIEQRSGEVGYTELSQNVQQTEQTYEAGGRGGTASIGECSTYSGLKADLPDLETDKFCTRYSLGDEICKLLEEQGFNEAAAVLDVGDLGLQELGFKVGQIAELNWALNKMLLENFKTLGGKEEETYKPRVSGGTGGAGGNSGREGGDGGFGEAPRIAIEQVHRFREIHGGVGGEGGAGGEGSAYAGCMEGVTPQNPISTGDSKHTAEDFPALFGASGGAGGWSHNAGGPGGLGEAAQIPIEDVGIFRKITGGFGGRGGASDNKGGFGGTGQGSRFPKLLVSIDEETRRRVPSTKLEDLKISVELRKRLQDVGFRTAGGLLEAHDTDFQPPHFKLGHVHVLTATLRKFIAQHAQSAAQRSSI
ncbi:hypothetical protein B0H11DRAFT_323741 [Mycena galericulata]|nr:hypothetical protein B0H11DRAFT_323741 [Mycena galericulata]